MAVGLKATNDVMALHSSTQSLSYNLFSRRDAPDLYCAVPEDRPVPSFVDHEWRFEGWLGRFKRPPGGFRPNIAAASVRMNGHYVFMRYENAAAPIKGSLFY